MTKMPPDVRIYLTKLSEFFLTNPHFFTDIFGSHPMEACLQMIEGIAQLNFKQTGEPNLTQQQFVEARKELDNQVHQEENPCFISHPGFPPYCLN